MPIYEYRCSSCGHQQEFLQKVSDTPVTVCTQCGKETFSKMLTAAGFQLKGSGWYATDFKNKGAAPAKPGEAKSGEAKSGEAKSGEAKSGETKSTDTKPAAETKSGGKDSSPSAPAAGSGTPST
jgi:putative FmdB family regulatory protein